MNEENIINVRNEIDRYGFSNIIAQRLNYRKAPKSYANWIHGWVWLDPKDDILKNSLDFYLGYPKKYNYNVTTIVPDENFKLALEDYGFTDVKKGGLPFIYTNQKVVRKKNDHLLVILPHSVSYYRWSEDDIKNLNNSFEKIYSLKKDFEKIDCLLYYDDFKKKSFDSLIKKFKLNVVVGARPNVSSSLSYIRDLFDKYDFVTSFGLGSGLLYSMFCGGKVSILEPIFEHSADFWRSDPYFKKYTNLTNIYLYQYSKQYLLDNYKFLYMDNPKNSQTNIEWAKKIIGFENKIEDKQLKYILSWTYNSKFKIVNKFLNRRIKNYFKNIS